MKKALFFLLLFPLVLSALKIDVTVNKNTISMNEQLELTLKIANDNRLKVEEPTPPSVPLFSFRNLTSSSSSSVVLEGTRLISEFSRPFVLSIFL